MKKLENGIEVAMEPSKVQPGATNVVIFAPTFEELQRLIEELSFEYFHAVFTLPEKASDNKWGAMGRVW